MNNYDFKSLSDKEFEALACDILGTHEKRRFERFKPGKDQGVDGRFFRDDDEVILQCKHYSNFNQLLGTLEAKEKKKVEILKPSRYMLAVSNPLSRQDKKKIAKIFSPFLHENDVYGSEDLNDLLGTNPDIEKRHYKLWLHSSEVLSTIFNHGILGRSASNLEEIRQSASRYAVTKNHIMALEHLRKRQVIIVSGEPGIGKTTLAGHLCIEAVADGYEFIEISNDIKEAESIFFPEKKQVFYFDDFLGRNYLDALEGHEGKQITSFIRRVIKDPSKLFILTSRSTILNQGKLLIDLFAHEKIEKNEYELRITSLSRLDKAKILYNHLFHSGLSSEYSEHIYDDEKYVDIIDHRNFNPRLISYITDPARLDSIPSENYSSFIDFALSKPSAIWEHPFVAQQDDFGRAMTLLVVLYRDSITEQDLSLAYHKYISAPANQSMRGRRDFVDTLRALTGSLLNRRISKDGEPEIDLFNPSIGDYVLSRYSNDVATLTLAFNCLAFSDGLHTLKGLHRAKLIQPKVAQSIASSLLTKMTESGSPSCPLSQVAELLVFSIRLTESDASMLSKMKILTKYIFERASPMDSLDDCLFVIEWALERRFCKPESALAFVARVHEGLRSEREVAACYSLLHQISNELEEKQSIYEQVNEAAKDTIFDNLSDFIELSDVYASCDPGDYESAHDVFKEQMLSVLSELGAPPDLIDFDELIQEWDLDEELDDYHKSIPQSTFQPRQTADDDTEDIHDLFSRD